jgi:hypothetical protein
MSSLLEAVWEDGEESSCDASSRVVHSYKLVGALKELPVLKTYKLKKNCNRRTVLK